MSERKFSVVPSTGLPSSNFSLHEPQVAVSSTRSVGIRFSALQCGQRVVIVVIGAFRSLNITQSGYYLVANLPIYDRE